MSSSMQASVVVDPRVGEVFGCLADTQNIPEFDRNCRSVSEASVGQIGERTTFRLDERLLPLRQFKVSDWRVDAFEPNRQIGWDYLGPGGPIAPTGIMTFERAGTDTRLSYRGDPRRRGALRFLSPVIARSSTSVWIKRMALIKDWLEAGRATGGGATNAQR